MFPPLACSTEEAIRNDRWFQQQEVRRCQESIEKCVLSRVVADRWFISSTSYILARDIILGLDAFEDHIADIDDKMIKEALILPFFVYVRTPVSTVLERMMGARKQYGGMELNGSLLTKQYRNAYLAHQEYFYDAFMLSFPDRILVVDGTKPSTSAAASVNAWCLKLQFDPSSLRDRYLSFCRYVSRNITGR